MQVRGHSRVHGRIIRGAPERKRRRHFKNVAHKSQFRERERLGLTHSAGV